jgi:hypothetical protein
MSDTTLPSPGEQPATDAPNTPGTTPEEKAALQAKIETISHQDLTKALGFDVDETEPVEDEPNTQDDPATQPGAEPAGEPETKPAEEAEEAEEPDPKPVVSRRRLSVAGLPDSDKELNAKAIALVRDGKAANLFEAMQSLVEDGAAAGNDGAAANGDDSPDSEDPPKTPLTLDEIQSKIASLRAERRQAKADFDADEEIRLTEEIEDLQLAILRAEKAEDRRQAEVSDYQTEYHAAVQEMETKFAELLDDEDSPFADLLEDRIEAAKARRDPALADPRHVLSIADELATMLGRASKAPSQPKARTPIADPPRREPVGAGVAPSGKTNPTITKAQAEAYIAQAPQETLAAALWPD